MRFIITGFFSLLLWGFVSFYSIDIGLPKWIAAICLVIIGITVQIIYAHLVNFHFDNIGLSELERNRLKSDKGVVPLWIVGVGFIARILMVSGTIFPLLELLGLFQALNVPV